MLSGVQSGGHMVNSASSWNCRMPFDPSPRPLAGLFWAELREALPHGRDSPPERGSDHRLQDFTGHADAKAILAYVGSRDRLSKSPRATLV